jgi:hypothetical protein
VDPPEFLPRAACPGISATRDPGNYWQITARWSKLRRSSLTLIVKDHARELSKEKKDYARVVMAIQQHINLLA